MTKRKKELTDYELKERAKKRAGRVLKKSPRWGLYRVLRDATDYFESFVDDEVDRASLKWHEPGEHCNWCCDTTFEEDLSDDCGGCQGRLVRFTAVGTRDFFRDIAPECEFCVNHRDEAEFCDSAGYRRTSAALGAVDLADELQRDAVAACSVEELKPLVEGFFESWRRESALKKEDFLWLARVCGATPKEAEAVRCLLPRLKSGLSWERDWWVDEERGLLSLCDSWDDFTEPSEEQRAEFLKSLEPTPISEVVNWDLVGGRRIEHHDPHVEAVRKKKEW